MITRTEKLVIFDHSANQDMVAAIERSQKMTPSMAAIVGHMLETGEMWLARAEGVRWMQPTCRQPPSISEIKTRFQTLRDRFLVLCHKYCDSELIPFEDVAGYLTSERFDDIVQEVLLHSARHRGQIALLLSNHDSESAKFTDFFRVLQRGLL